MNIPKLRFPKSETNESSSSFGKVNINDGVGLNRVPIEALSFRGIFKYSLEIGQIAGKLRKNPTLAEKYLWEKVLKHSNTGYKFTRQKPIHHFILDFYCSKLLLGIEADGEIHNLQQEQDQNRSDYLASMGIKIIRFKNEEILNEIEVVRNRILEFLQERQKEIDNPLTPLTGGNKTVGFVELKTGRSI